MCNNRYTLDGKIHDTQRLRELQKLPLDNKILITQARLIEWYKYWNGQLLVKSIKKSVKKLVNITSKFMMIIGSEN